MATAKKAAVKTAATKAAAPKVSRGLYLAGAAANRAVKALESLEAAAGRLLGATTDKQKAALKDLIDKRVASVKAEVAKVQKLAAE